jgi:hypothetical protein
MASDELPDCLPHCMQVRRRPRSTAVSRAMRRRHAGRPRPWRRVSTIGCKSSRASSCWGLGRRGY